MMKFNSLLTTCLLACSVAALPNSQLVLTNPGTLLAKRDQSNCGNFLVI